METPVLPAQSVYTPSVTRGWLITFEGGEGSGKSTQISRLAQHLTNRGFTVLTTREPGGTPMAEGVRELLLDSRFDPEPLVELMLLEASRSDHVRRVLRPALERGEIVLCDRYADSSTVYQGVVGGVPREAVRHLNELATGGLDPDLTIVLDLDPREGLSRARARNAVGGGASRIDDRPLEYHERVRDGFLELVLSDPERVRLVPADGTADEVFALILEELPEALK